MRTPRVKIRSLGRRACVLLALIATVALVKSSPAGAQAPSPGAPDFESEWRWLQSEFPEARAYVPREKAVLPVQDLLAWAGAATTLSIFDWDCRRIRVRSADGAFKGNTNIREQIAADGQTKSVSYSEAVFGATVEVVEAGIVSYEKVKGRWVETGGQGYSNGGYTSLFLSRVSRDAAWYSGAIVGLSMECHQKTNEVTSCTEAGTRTCSWCSEWGFHKENRSGQRLMGWHQSVREITVAAPKEADCSRACPSTAMPEKVRRAQSLLKGHTFFLDMEAEIEHPLIFRTHEACTRYRRIHHIPASDSNPW